MIIYKFCNYTGEYEELTGFVSSIFDKSDTKISICIDSVREILELLRVQHLVFRRLQLPVWYYVTLQQI